MLVKNIILMQKLLFALLLSTAEQKPSGRSAGKLLEKAAPCKVGNAYICCDSTAQFDSDSPFSGENASKSLSKEFF